MMDNSDFTTIKLVDFGLSKMIGPSETSTDPFGTLVRIGKVIVVVLCGPRSADDETIR